MSRPLIIVAILVVVLFAGYFGMVALRMSWLIHQSAALVEASSPYQQKGLTGHPRILVLGDSTGVGTGTASNKGSIAGRFGQDFPNAEIVNLSVNGLKTGELDASFPSYPAESFDLVVLQIGANDILQRTPLEEVSKSLTSVFAKANATGKRAVALHCGNVGLAPLFGNWPLNVYFRGKSLKLRAMYRPLAEANGVAYVDLFHEAKDDPFMADMDKFYAADGLHLTEEGYGEWYRQLRNTMTAAGIELH